MTQDRWAELRQVAFATLDHAAAVQTATELLALGPGFDDPLLAAMHLADFTAPLGPDTYVEVLAPTTPDHSVARRLGRVGGSSGWVLSTQVPSLDGVKEPPNAVSGSRCRRRRWATTSSSSIRSTSACCSSSTRSYRAPAGSGTASGRDGGWRRDHVQQSDDPLRARPVRSDRDRRRRRSRDRPGSRRRADGRAV